MDWLMYLSLSPPDMLAGFCGSIVHAAVSGRRAPMTVLLAVLAGTLTANYTAIEAASYFGLASTSHIFTAFIMGFSGITIIRSMLRRFVPSLFVEPKDGNISA